jgi:hypothetical protein
MSDETNGTIGPQLAELASRLAQMERTVSQMKYDITQVRQDVSQARGDIAQMRRDMGLVSAVLDEHDRMIAVMCRKLGIGPPRTVGAVALFVAGVLLLVPSLCAILFISEIFSTQDPLSSLVVCAAVIGFGALGVWLINQAVSAPRPDREPFSLMPATPRRKPRRQSLPALMPGNRDGRIAVHKEWSVTALIREWAANAERRITGQISGRELKRILRHPERRAND